MQQNQQQLRDARQQQAEYQRQRQLDHLMEIERQRLQLEQQRRR